MQLIVTYALYMLEKVIKHTHIHTHIAVSVTDQLTTVKYCIQCALPFNMKSFVSI